MNGNPQLNGLGLEGARLMLYVGIAVIWLIVIWLRVFYERITGKKVRKGHPKRDGRED